MGFLSTRFDFRLAFYRLRLVVSLCNAVINIFYNLSVMAIAKNVERLITSIEIVYSSDMYWFSHA